MVDKGKKSKAPLLTTTSLATTHMQSAITNANNSPPHNIHLGAGRLPRSLEDARANHEAIEPVGELRLLRPQPRELAGQPLHIRHIQTPKS